ncbi:MAG: carbohydrate ABC transporter permease [Cellulomonas sp.]
MSANSRVAATSGTVARGTVSPRVARPESKQRSMLWLSTPALVWFTFWTFLPVVGIFLVSMTRYQGLLDTPTFIGLDNFSRVFADPTFWDAMRNTAVQMFIALPIMLPAAFMLGYWLTRRPRGWKFLSVFFFTPGLISIAVKGTIFYAMLSPNGGLNGMLKAVNLDSLTHAWYADTSTSLGVIIAVDLWQGIAWTAVLFSAHMSTIPASLYESAMIDGAGEWRRMWTIAFPMTRGYFGTLLMLQFLWTLFNSAAVVLILTQGGPGNSSTTLAYLVYQKAFQQQDLGYSQAAGVVLFAIGVLGLTSVRKLVRPAY